MSAALYLRRKKLHPVIVLDKASTQKKGKGYSTDYDSRLCFIISQSKISFTILSYSVNIIGLYYLSSWFNYPCTGVWTFFTLASFVTRCGQQRRSRKRQTKESWLPQSHPSAICWRGFEEEKVLTIIYCCQFEYNWNNHTSISYNNTIKNEEACDLSSRWCIRVETKRLDSRVTLSNGKQKFYIIIFFDLCVYPISHQLPAKM